MPLKRRRIFRGTLAARGRAVAGPSMAIGAACALGIGGIVALAAALPRGVAGLAASSPLPSAAPAEAAPVLRASPHEAAVVSGDTLRIGSQVVRLQGIEAPARGEACPATPDCGAASANALAQLIEGRSLECRLAGEDGMGRPFATCVAGGTDLGQAQVAAGRARARPGAGALPGG